MCNNHGNETAACGATECGAACGGSCSGSCGGNCGSGCGGSCGEGCGCSTAAAHTHDHDHAHPQVHEHEHGAAVVAKAFDVDAMTPRMVELIVETLDCGVPISSIADRVPPADRARFLEKLPDEAQAIFIHYWAETRMVLDLDSLNAEMIEQIVYGVEQGADITGLADLVAPEEHQLFLDKLPESARAPFEQYWAQQAA